MKTVSYKEFKTAHIQWMKGTHGSHEQRLGQWLMNRLVPGITNPDIFYVEEDFLAYKKFWDAYVIEE